MTDTPTSRRTVLKSIGATSVLGVGLSSAASATTPQSNGEGPTRVRGQIQLEYEFTPETYSVEKWYVSPDLEEHYGTRRTRFDRTVYDRTKVSDEITESMPEHGQRVETAQLDKRVGTEDEWATHIESQRNSGGVSIASESDYSGPIWEYDKSSDGYYTKTAPINVVWETEYATLSDVTSKLNEGDFHDVSTCANTKYVYFSYYGFLSQDEQVGTQDYCGNAQDHVRMWSDRGNFGSYDGQFEIGSLHHDPEGHNYGCCCDNFRFEEPEDRMQDYWRNNTSADVGLVYLGNARDWSSDCKEANGDYAAYIDWY